MQDIDPAGELDGVDGPVGVALMVPTTSNTPAEPKPVITLASWCLPPAWGQVDGMTKTSLTSSGIASRSRLAELTHLMGLRACFDIASIVRLGIFLPGRGELELLAVRRFSRRAHKRYDIKCAFDRRHTSATAESAQNPHHIG